MGQHLRARNTRQFCRQPAVVGMGVAEDDAPQAGHAVAVPRQCHFQRLAGGVVARAGVHQCQRFPLGQVDVDRTDGERGGEGDCMEIVSYGRLGH